MLADDNKLSRSDMKLVSTAIRNGWHVSPQTKAKAVAAAEAILASTANDRNRIAAMKLLLDFDRADIAREALDAEHHPTENTVKIVFEDTIPAQMTIDALPLEPKALTAPSAVQPTEQ